MLLLCLSPYPRPHVKVVPLTLANNLPPLAGKNDRRARSELKLHLSSCEWDGQGVGPACVQVPRVDVRAVGDMQRMLKCRLGHQYEDIDQVLSLLFSLPSRNFPSLRVSVTALDLPTPHGLACPLRPTPRPCPARAAYTTSNTPPHPPLLAQDPSTAAQSTVSSRGMRHAAYRLSTLRSLAGPQVQGRSRAIRHDRSMR